ncbi:MAG: T9SS type A sorting domain-containing protein [Saprospiraceae bacterium]|nr:T9SS type A sorting domain-containing protein [Saprospiraceae bacterium]
MLLKYQLYYFILSLSMLLSSIKIEAQITLSSLNDFEDGTTQFWSMGGGEPLGAVTNIEDGGPNGNGDNFLNVISTNSGPGGKLVINNSSPDWVGDWTSAGINYITFQVNNLSGASVDLRIALDGSGGRICTENGISIPSGSGWIGVSFPVLPSDFVTVSGGFSIEGTLADVNTFRFLNNPIPDWQGVNSTNTVGFDNISADAVALPVKFVAFDGFLDGNKVKLQWETSSEINNEKFVIEQSINTVDFKTMGEVNGSGNSTNSNKYSFVISDLPSGNNYFRLKQIDFDGKSQFSDIIYFDVGTRREAGEFYPNPSTSGIVSIHISEANLSDLTTHVYDLTGKLIQTFSPELNHEAGRLYYDFSFLRGGFYIVKIGENIPAIIRKLYIHY